MGRFLRHYALILALFAVSGFLGWLLMTVMVWAADHVGAPVLGAMMVALVSLPVAAFSMIFDSPQTPEAHDD